MEKIRDHINFRTEEIILKDLAYSDNVYAWLLLHSYYNKEEKYNYIYKENINFARMQTQIHRSRQTISKRFHALIDKGIIREFKYNGKKCYKIPYYKEFEELHGETVFQLLCLPFKDQKEELIKVYAYLLKKKRIMEQESNYSFLCSGTELIEMGGKGANHDAAFERMRGILTILQGAGIIKFRTLLPQQKEDGSWEGQKMEVYRINKKASDEWLGIKREEAADNSSQ